MSRTKFDDDLEAILSEFSDFSKSLEPTAKHREAPRAAEEYKCEPAAPAPAEPETPWEPEMELPTPETELPENELPEIEEEEEVTVPPLEEQAEPKQAEPSPEATRRISAPITAIETAKKTDAVKPEAPKRQAPEKGAEKEKKKLSVMSRIAGAIVSIVFMCLSVIVLAWVALNVHPNSATVAAAAGGTKISLPDKLDGYMNNLASDALGELTYIKKIYTIQESDTAGPVPSAANFGSCPIDRASEVLEVIEKARETGLLDGQDVIFDPNANFYYDSEIKYYCDETILAICWKEVIEGNTVSCCEVKVADASQLRRKIADDTFGSPNQYVASSLSKQTNAVVAMNADFYQFRDFGIVVYQRELYRYSAANYTGKYSMYNCVDNLFINSSGEFVFMHKGDEISEEELRQFIADNDILFSIAFGPILVENGEVQECTWYPAGEPTTGYSRAGIGYVDKLHYFYMNLNHSPEKAARWTVTQFAEHMHEKGIDTAYGLDGGQTGEVLYNHVPYNYIDFNAERLVSDIIYFATAIPEEEAAR